MLSYRHICHALGNASFCGFQEVRLNESGFHGFQSTLQEYHGPPTDFPDIISPLRPRLLYLHGADNVNDVDTEPGADKATWFCMLSYSRVWPALGYVSFHGFPRGSRANGFRGFLATLEEYHGLPTDILYILSPLHRRILYLHGADNVNDVDTELVAFLSLEVQFDFGG